MSTKGVTKPIHRLGWLVAIWTLSVLGLGAFAAVFRLLMSTAGLTP